MNKELKKEITRMLLLKAERECPYPVLDYSRNKYWITWNIEPNNSWARITVPEPDSELGWNCVISFSFRATIESPKDGAEGKE